VAGIRRGMGVNSDRYETQMFASRKKGSKVRWSELILTYPPHDMYLVRKGKERRRDSEKSA
jgi:hypothetical protein